MPWIVEKERPLAPDRLELVSLGKSRSAVELREDVARKAHRAREDPVGAGRADELLPVHLLGLTGQQPRSTDAVAADVHEAPAVQVRPQADVLRVVQRIAETGADKPELSDRTLLDKLTEPHRLRVVAVHERLRQQSPGTVSRVERLLHRLHSTVHRLLAEHVLSRLHGPD